MNYLGAIFNILNGSFSLLGFVKRVIIEKTLITEDSKLTALNKKIMSFVLGWYFFNIVVSAIMLFFSYGKLFSFFEMVLAWSIISLAIVFFVYSRLKETPPDQLTSWTFVEKYFGLQKLLSFSIGLDVMYIAVGGLLIDRGFLTNSSMFVGFGAAILYQGLVVIVIDTITYLLNRYSVQKVMTVLKESSES